MEPMKQQCFLWSVWLTWMGLPILAVVMGIMMSPWAGVFVLIAGIGAQAYYIKLFPKVSHLMGYGSVENVPVAVPPRDKKVAKVILYTANVCPFCPIVKRRLQELQQSMGFELVETDITFRPDIVQEKGFRSVPVVEVDGRHWIGNATSTQLVAFLTGTKEEAANIKH